MGEEGTWGRKEGRRKLESEGKGNWIVKGKGTGK